MTVQEINQKVGDALKLANEVSVFLYDSWQMGKKIKGVKDCQTAYELLSEATGNMESFIEDLEL
jgi:hypothetical protein